MPDQIKAALRKTIKEVRSKLSLAYQSSSSKHICQCIQALEHYKESTNIGLYFAVNGEIDLTDLWHHAGLQGKHCYFPVLNNNSTLSFLPATPKSSLKKNPYGIPEPDLCLDKALPINELHLIIMPLVAFDIRCTRLGMGAGYYDRTLIKYKGGSLLGVAYPFQQVDFIESMPWDIPLDAVITQQVLYKRYA